MDDEYIGIKEFAELIGYNRTSIYKILNRPGNRLSRFCRKQGKSLKINKKAVFLFPKESDKVDIDLTLFDKETIQTGNSLSNNIIKEKNNENLSKENNIIENLNKQIDFLMKENENKSKQIQELNESLNKVLVNLDQQQKLALVDKQKILELEEYKKSEENKSFFQKLFSKKK